MEPKKFLFISPHALTVDLAWNVLRDGNYVKYCILEESEKEVADGFLEKIDNWRTEVDWADVIIFDDVGFGAEAQELRTKGKLVIGGTIYTDKLEEDRAFGQDELKKAGVSTLPHRDFDSFDEAIAYVEENPNKYVIKPSGKVQYNKSLLFVGEEESGKDVIQVLTDYRKAWSEKIPNFQLQKKVTGVEVAVGAFFNGHHFVYPINVNFEHKKLFPGNIGPSTGEMGTSMFWSEPNRIFNYTLKKMESKLAEEKYVGYIDINCIVNGYGIYPLEWTTRFGYPTIHIQQEGILSSISEFLYGLASGEDVKLRTKSGFQIGVMVVVPPFPFFDKETFEVQSKDSVVIFNKERLDGIHVGDIKIINGEFVITGQEGIALIVCGSGTTMKQAQQQAYSRIKNIYIPHMYYRDDIGERWSEDSDRLNTWGYLRE